MFGMKRRQTDKRLCCPVCGRAPVSEDVIIDLHEPYEGWQRRMWRYQCPRRHMQTGIYESAGVAWKAWLDLIGLTEHRLKGHDNDR